MVAKSLVQHLADQLELILRLGQGRSQSFDAGDLFLGSGLKRIKLLNVNPQLAAVEGFNGFDYVQRRAGRDRIAFRNAENVPVRELIAHSVLGLVEHETGVRRKLELAESRVEQRAAFAQSAHRAGRLA